MPFPVWVHRGVSLACEALSSHFKDRVGKSSSVACGNGGFAGLSTLAGHALVACAWRSRHMLQSVACALAVGSRHMLQSRASVTSHASVYMLQSTLFLTHSLRIEMYCSVLQCETAFSIVDSLSRVENPSPPLSLT